MIDKSTISSGGPGQFLLFNDCHDLGFALAVGDCSPDGWAPFHCELQMFDSNRSQFRPIYSSKNSAVVSEIHQSELKRFAEFVSAALSSKTKESVYKSETKEFQIRFSGKADIYEVTVTIDLCTMSPEKLEAGTGEAEISLFFKSTRSEISAFAGQINSRFS